jgi:hypothetical protein
MSEKCQKSDKSDMAVLFEMLPIALLLSNLSLMASNQCGSERDQ